MVNFDPSRTLSSTREPKLLESHCTQCGEPLGCGARSGASDRTSTSPGLCVDCAFDGIPCTD